MQDYKKFQSAVRLGQVAQREWPPPPFAQRDTHPAVQVSWEDAVAFCKWLTEREQKAGSLAAEHRYRLPRDAEWSCAALLGDRENREALPLAKDAKISGVFPWGEAWPPPRGVDNLPDETGRAKSAIQEALPDYNDGYAWTAPVGSFRANELGIHDLGGNVREWCEDATDWTRVRRVVRGGSWGYGISEADLLSSRRGNGNTDMRSMMIGFRVVIAPVEGAATAPGKASTP